MSCGALTANAGFVAGLLNYVDCQAQAIGSGGYQALASPGSTFSIVLTALLTLFVALFGYRMLLGRTPVLRDGVLALVKVGIVLALATGWTAYRTLIYDIAFSAPAELASDIGRPAGLPGAGGGLVWRLDNADRLIVALSTLGEGDVSATAAVQPAPPYLTPGPATGVRPPVANRTGEEARSTGLSAAFAFASARVLFLAGAAGALAALRLIAALLLALGPFFFAFLLFDGTRGLFEGWLRVLAGTALGALGAAIALGVELALIELRLANWLALRAAGYATPGAAVELMVVTLIFALALLAILVAAARVASGFRLPPVWRGVPAQLAAELRGEEGRIAIHREPALAAAGRSRAVSIADAVAASQRREAGPIVASAGAGRSVDGVRALARPAAGRDAPAPPPMPLGQTYRRTRNRASPSASRRERGR